VSTALDSLDIHVNSSIGVGIISLGNLNQSAPDNGDIRLHCHMLDVGLEQVHYKVHQNRI